MSDGVCWVKQHPLGCAKLSQKLRVATRFRARRDALTVKVIFELKLQGGKTAELVQMVREALPATRQYDGCKHVDLCLGLDDTTQVILILIYRFQCPLSMALNL